MAMDEATAQDLCAYECMWKREPGSVMLGIARSKSGQGGLLIENESLNNNGTTGIDVTLYGALHAKKDCNTGQIHVSVQTDINHTDSSFQFDHYVCMGGSPASSEKPPKYILFESKEFPSHFITWNLADIVDMPDDAGDSTCSKNTVKCEYLPKTADDLPYIKISTSTGSILEPADSQIKRYVWVVPVDNQDSNQFALRAFDQHYYLVFKQTTGETMMVPSGQISPELTIFKLHSL
ncbi:uncharacterized protein [Dysidea avara]|uniref:uncharacterized protein n=1 Tax=Dysidea avara TaxID=196820 RepID=UPI0033348C49